MGVPLNHQFLIGFSLTKTIQLLGYPHFWNPPDFSQIIDILVGGFNHL